MIEGKVGGKLASCPEQRVGKTGEYVVAKVRVISKGEPLPVNVIAFDEMAQQLLLGLNDGDAVTLTGRLTPRAWVDREGEARPALGMVVTQVLTATRKHDEFPEDYDWLERAAA